MSFQDELKYREAIQSAKTGWWSRKEMLKRFISGKSYVYCGYDFRFVEPDWVEEMIQHMIATFPDFEITVLREYINSDAPGHHRCYIKFEKR